MKFYSRWVIKSIIVIVVVGCSRQRRLNPSQTGEEQLPPHPFSPSTLIEVQEMYRALKPMSDLVRADGIRECGVTQYRVTRRKSLTEAETIGSFQCSDSNAPEGVALPVPSFKVLATKDYGDVVVVVYRIRSKICATAYFKERNGWRCLEAEQGREVGNDPLGNKAVVISRMVHPKIVQLEIHALSHPSELVELQQFGTVYRWVRVGDMTEERPGSGKGDIPN